MTAAQLRGARARLALTQQQLAVSLGVTRVSVARWERAVRPIPRLVVLAMRALRTVTDQSPP